MNLPHFSTRLAATPVAITCFVASVFLPFLAKPKYKG